MLGLLKEIPIPRYNKTGWPWTEETLPTIYEGSTAYPKISIVTPSYNQVEFIEETIRSVLLQNYPNLEFIIIDGGSTDGTIEILKKYEQWITYWVSEKDKGQSDALNKGFALAKGDIFAWQNTDDIYFPNVFFKVQQAFEKNTNKNIVFGDYTTINEDSKLINYEYAFDFNLAHFIYEGFHLNSQAMFWRREVHDRFGLFNVLLHRTMDYDLILRMGIKEGSGSFLRLNDTPLASFRRHPQQKTLGFDDKVLKEHKLIVDLVGIKDKYTNTGRLKRLFFRVRRLAWYKKRGGFFYALNKVI